MALREELEASGNVLFRWRSYLPLFFLAYMVLSLIPDLIPIELTRVHFLILAALFGLAGLWLRAYTVGHAALGTSGRTTKAPTAAVLNTTGIYSVLRHPLYVGNYLMWLSAAMLTRSFPIMIITTLVFWLYYERIMFAEEQYLRGQFGAAFEEWAAHTPAIVPRLSLWKRPETPICFRTILRRECWGITGLIATCALLDITYLAAAPGELLVPNLWLVLIGPSLVLSLAVRIWKRGGLFDAPARAR